MTYSLKDLARIILILGAIYLASEGKAGWGWCLFIAFAL